MHCYKILDRAVVCSLILRGEETRGQFAVLPVVVEALAALMFSYTALVRAGAIFLVDFHDAFHRNFSSQIIFAAVFSVAQKGRKRE
jgi:hypothetical protein